MGKILIAPTKGIIKAVCHCEDTKSPINNTFNLMCVYLDLNFNFYSGEINSEGSEWFAIGIAIFSVTFTVFCQRVYDNFKANEGLDQLYNFTKTECDKIGENAILQAEGLIKLCHVLKNPTVGDFNVPKVSAFDTDLVSDWTSLEFYNSIVNRRKCKDSAKLIQEYRNVKVALKQAKELEKAIVSSFDQLNSKYIKIQDEWKEYVQSIPSLLNYYKIERRQNRVISDDFLTRFDNAIGQWSSLTVENKNEMSIIFTHVVEPLLVVCNDYQLDERAYRLMTVLHQLKSAYNDMKHTKYRYRSSFTRMARKLVAVKVNIKNGLDSIGSHELKSRFQF